MKEDAHDVIEITPTKLEKNITATLDSIASTSKDKKVSSKASMTSTKVMGFGMDYTENSDAASRRKNLLTMVLPKHDDYDSVW